MEGVVNGLASVIPILPDTGAVTAKNSSGPPVEVMPVPQDSFPSDSMTSELLNTPYTLKLNSDGRSGGGAAGECFTGSPAAEEGAAKEPPDGAYKLSLGDDGEPPVKPEIAYEMARVKNYEALGKLAAQRAVRTVREVITGHPAQVDTEDSAAPPGAAVIQTETPLPAGPSIPPAFPPPADIAPETGVVTDIPMPEAGIGAPPADIDAPEPAMQQPGLMHQTAAHLAIRLTASDYEAMMEMEPDLRDTFMRMLGNEAEVLPEPEVPARPVIPDTPHLAPPGPQALPKDQRAAPPVVSPAAGQETPPVVPTAPARQPVLAEPPILTEPPAPPIPEVTVARERVLIPEGPVQRVSVQAQQVQTAAPENPLPNLAAGIVRTSAPEPAAAAGSMQNLKKLKELPYALYLFGPAAEGKLIGRDTGEEDEPKRPKPSDANPAGYLRLSEAVRMAAVVHQIYRGGTGRFDEDTPWYRPYVRYALKNGIIKSGEFEDYSEFATRAEAASIFAGSVPEAEFPVLNRVAGMMDIDEQSGYGQAVYRLLRAGVFLPAAGGLFYPERPITRAEAAVIIGRIVTPADRKRF